VAAALAAPVVVAAPEAAVLGAAAPEVAALEVVAIADLGARAVRAVAGPVAVDPGRAPGPDRAANRPVDKVQPVVLVVSAMFHRSRAI